MDQQHLQALRERIRAVCLHDQAQWDATWKEVLGDLNSSRRGRIMPSVFFEVLEMNRVLLGRSEARFLLRQFQEPNGAVAAPRFLRWMALSAPADHVNPDLLFAQLPQPYRRIQKVLQHDILDAAWEIITTDSARFKDESSSVGEDAMDSDRSQSQHKNDYDLAERLACDPTWQIPLDNDAQHVGGLASHCLLPIVIAAINSELLEDPATNAAPLLRVVNTVTEGIKVLGDIPVVFPVDTPTPAGTPDTATKIHVLVKQLSTLQRTNDSSCYLAVHLVETTTVEFPAEQDPNSDTKPPAPTTRECVNVYAIRTDMAQAPSDEDGNSREFSCQLIAVINSTPSSPESSISSIVLSPDSQFLAVTFVGSAIVALYSIHCNRDTEARVLPLILSSPTFQVDLEPTRSPFMEDECEPILHFLVTPSTNWAQYQTSTRAAPNTYAFAVCYGLKVLKFVLPSTVNSSASPSSPLLLTPVKSWEHLTKITTSAQDLTTQYVVVGCQDGTIVVWDVLQDVDGAFLSPLGSADTKMERSSSRPSGVEISNVYCQAGYVVALSQSQQRLYFFDVRERGKAVLVRELSPPSMPSSTSTHQTASHCVVSMVNLAAATATAGIPMTLVEYSNGMVMLYDVRTAEAVGSFQTTLSTAASPTSHLVNSSSVHSCGVTSIVGNHEALAVATTSTTSKETAVKLYSWRDIFLVCFPFFATILEQRQEELTCASVKELFVSTEVATSAAPPSTTTAPSVSSASLESMFLAMAGELSSSPQRTKKSPIGAASLLQSPGGRSSLSSNPSTFTLFRKTTDPASHLNVMLEPLIPDDKAFFEQYCREYLDPLVVADKEAKLHRKRRELLRTMSAGGSW